MISWQSIMSVFNTKGTLLKWLQKLEKALNDGVLLSVTVNTVSEGVITLTFNFADGSKVTTPQIDIPQGAQGPQGIPGADGTDGTDGTDGRDALVQNRALSSANITSPMAVPIEALNRTAFLGEPIVMFATDTTENKTYMLIGTVTDVGSPDTNPYVFVTYSSKVDITGMTGPRGPQGAPGFSDVPIPTEEDNGKVLGVVDGAYALQAAEGTFKGYRGTIFTNPEFGVRVSAVHSNGSVTIFEGDGGSIEVENVVRLIIAGELEGSNSRWTAPREGEGAGYAITYLGKGWSDYTCYKDTTASIYIEAVPTEDGFQFGAIAD